MFSRVPLHDEYADAADAFRYAAVTSKIRTGKVPMGLIVPGTNAPPEGFIAPPSRTLEINRPQLAIHGNNGGTAWMK